METKKFDYFMRRKDGEKWMKFNWLTITFVYLKNKKKVHFRIIIRKVEKAHAVNFATAILLIQQIVKGTMLLTLSNSFMKVESTPGVLLLLHHGLCLTENVRIVLKRGWSSIDPMHRLSCQTHRLPTFHYLKKYSRSSSTLSIFYTPNSVL